MRLKQLCFHNSVRCNACLSPVPFKVQYSYSYCTCTVQYSIFNYAIDAFALCTQHVPASACVLEALRCAGAHSRHTHTHVFDWPQTPHRRAEQRRQVTSRQDTPRGTCCVRHSHVRLRRRRHSCCRCCAVCKTRAVGGIAHSNGSRSLRFRTPAESRRIASTDNRNTPVRNARLLMRMCTVA